MTASYDQNHMTDTLKRILILVAFFATLKAYPYSGKVYELGNPTHFIFNYTEEWLNLPDGSRLVTRFTAPNGSVAVAENVLFLHGKLSEYTVDQKQMGYTNTLEVEGESALYTRVDTKTGHRKQKKDDWGDNYIVIPELLSFAVKHWDEIVQGDTVHFRVAVLEEMDTYGFKIFKDSEVVVKGRKAFVFKIKPSSIFIAAVLPASYLTLDAKDKFPLRFRGPALPRLKSGPSNQRDLEADMVYSD